MIDITHTILVRTQHLILGYLRHYLETNNPKSFTSKQVSETTGGSFNGRDLTISLSKLNITPKRSSKRIEGKPKTIYPYNAPTVLEVLQSLDIHPYNLEELFSMFNSNIPLKTTTYGISNGVSMSHSQAGFIPSVSRPVLYTKSDVFYYRDQWKKHWNNNYDFEKCYLFYLSLFSIAKVKECKVEFYGTTKKQYCTYIPEQYWDEDEYGIIKQSLINKLGFTTEQFSFDICPTRTVSRLACQIANPKLKWSDSSNQPVYETHHLCRTPHCFDHNHYQPLIKAPHKELHDFAEDAHPYNNPAKHFQVVKPAQPSQPNKSKVIPYYAINRHGGVPFKDELLIELGNGAIVKGKTVAHVFENGNYKGK